MKKIIGISLIMAFAAAGSIHADGEAIFKGKGCGSCHHATKDQLSSGLGPSLQNIAAAYNENGGKDALVKFLNGEGEPIVAPKKFNMMKGQLSNTKKLSDAERGELADFILSN